MTTRCVATGLCGVLLMSSAVSVYAAEAAGVSHPVRNGWDRKWFEYERPDELIVRAATPSAAQVNYVQRPPQVAERADALNASSKDARPRAVGPLDVLHLRYVDATGDVVPALLCTPKSKKGPFPVVVAVHGLTSNKAQVCAQIGPALAERGFAVLAADMPRPGERPGEPRSVLDRSNPVKAFEVFKQAVVNVRQLIDLAETRPELDTGPGVVLVGYSMGSWINSVVGPSDDRVRAMVMMVGGAHDLPPAALLIPQVVASDPRMAIAHFAGRPLLMLGAKRDPVVPPEMCERLFAAAAEPKELLWYDCGHLLVPEAYEEAAEWVAKTVRSDAENADARRADGRTRRGAHAR
jgi:dienelactone hydrolase